MEPVSRSQVAELQAIVTKMPVNVIWVNVLPELGVRWRDVSRAVRNSRLPMQPSSVARVLSKHVARTLTKEEVEEIVERLRLKLVATQDRKWHVIKLLEPTDEEITISRLIHTLPSRISQEIKKSRAGRNMRPEVQSILMNELVYISARLVSDTRESAALLLATPPGQPVALVSTLTSSILRASVVGLGYNSFEDAHLFGSDVRSLLRVHAAPSGPPAPREYRPAPVVTPHGIDFTCKQYNQDYVEEIIGPDPPHLTDLQITAEKPFYDSSRLNKTIELKLELRCEDVASTLRAWAARGAIAPTSDFLKIFNQIKCNKFQYDNEM